MATSEKARNADSPVIIRERPRWRVWRTLARLFPWQDCVLCGRGSQGCALCAFCRRALPRLPRGADHPAGPAGGRAAAGPHALPAAFRRPSTPGGRRGHCPCVLAVRHRYAFPLDVLITRFKYGGELALAPVLAALMAPPPLPPMPPQRILPASPVRWRPSRWWPARLAPGPGDGHRPLLVPVPSGRARLRERGFDPAWLLAQAYGRRFGLALGRAERVREVAPQAGQGVAARLRSPQGVFRLPPVTRPVLLLDDVLTTGATLAALGAAAVEAGAPWVGAVVLARTCGGGS